MARQNRVTPAGDIISTPARGTLMGNRGCLHNDRQEIRRFFQTRRWIACRLAFKNRRRPLMAPGRYTELFFLDEATALAAGHRPCAECRREDYRAFRTALVRGSPHLFSSDRPPAAEIDAVLHERRINHSGHKVTYRDRLNVLPDGSFVRLANGEKPYLVWRNRLWGWSPSGYTYRRDHPFDNHRVDVLTPDVIVFALQQGYRGTASPFVTINDGAKAIPP